MKNPVVKLLIQLICWHLLIAALFYFAAYYISIIPVKYHKRCLFYSLYGLCLFGPGFLLYIIGSFLIRKFLILIVKLGIIKKEPLDDILYVLGTIYTIFWLSHFFLLVTGVIEL